MRRPEETPAQDVGLTDDEERLHRAAHNIGVDLQHLQEAYRTAGVWAVRLEEEARQATVAAQESDRPDEIAKVVDELMRAAALARTHERSVESFLAQVREAARVVASEMPTS
jgi:hypothetical protein